LGRFFTDFWSFGVKFGGLERRKGRKGEREKATQKDINQQPKKPTSQPDSKTARQQNSRTAKKNSKTAKQ